jgi:hypothetical protein
MGPLGVKQGHWPSPSGLFQPALASLRSLWINLDDLMSYIIKICL